MSVVLNRNSTNFAVQVHEYLKGLDFSSEDQRSLSFLKYYQNLLRMFTTRVNIDSRGILVYHTMGLGKTILGVAIAMDFIDMDREVIILLTKSLQENMRQTIYKYIKLRTKVDPLYKLGTMPESDLKQYIDKHFSFVSMNASNMMKQMLRAAEGQAGKEFSLDSKLEQIVSSGTLDGKLIIVDEAQNLFRAITNGSKNAKAFYDMVIASRDCKLIFLSGTPISSNPFEIVPCFNMIGSSVPGKTLFPESYGDFNKYFVDRDAVSIKNKAKFQNRIFGLVSHVHHELKTATGGPLAVEFPEKFPMIVERVPMDSEQYVIYQLARDKESEEGKYATGREKIVPSMQKPKKDFSSSYKQKSRQLSNYCPPASHRDQKFSSIDVYTIPEVSINSPKFRDVLANVNKHRKQIGFVYSQFVGAGGLGSLQRFLELHGWRVHSLQTNAKKALANKEEHVVEPTDDMEELLEDPIDSSVVISDVEGAGQKRSRSRRARSGPRNARTNFANAIDAMNVFSMINSRLNTVLQPYVTQLAKTGGSKIGGSKIDNIWTQFINPEDFAVHGGDDSHRTFAIISGSVDTDMRQKIQDIFNSDENRHGGKIDLLLISSTGAEGLDLKNVRHLHILEPYWNYARIAQIEARGVRNDSHTGLPKESRNVQPYIYLGVKPLELTDVVKTSVARNGVVEPTRTTDEELYYESLRNQQMIDSFLTAVKETSIECQLNEPTAYKCRVCNPTNTQLYYDDIDLDMKTSDPCTDTHAKTIAAREVIVNGTKYYYTEDSTNIYGWKIFEYDELIKGYREMAQDIPMYAEIADAITQTTQG